MCRAAGLSDTSHAEAVADWIATSSEAVAERLPIDHQGAAYRAAG